MDLSACSMLRVSKNLCTNGYNLNGTRTVVEGPFFPLGNTNEKALNPNPGNDKSGDSENDGDDNIMGVSINQTGKRNTKESADDDEVSSESDVEATETPTTSTPKGPGKKRSLFSDSTDEDEPLQKNPRTVGSLFTSADRDLLVRIEKRLERIECSLKRSDKKV